jgi:hypothetical protein
MKTSTGSPFILIKYDSDPNIKKLPGRLIYRILSRFYYLVFRKIFHFPKLISLLLSEFICILRTSKTFSSKIQ